MNADPDTIYMELLQHRTKAQSRQRDADDFDAVWDDIAAGIAQMQALDPDIELAAPDESDDLD